jgi:EF hand
VAGAGHWRADKTKTKDTPMKNSNKMILAMLMLGSSVWLAAAQPSDGQRPPPPDGAPQDGAPPGGGPPEGGGPGGPGGGPGPGMRHHRPPPLPIILALDTNHDGVIEADEIANAPAALKTLDKNGDGQLTPDEYMPPHPPGAGTNRPPVPPIVAALDLNGDGIIDANEIAQASESLKKLDKNGDGMLTRNEFAPPPPRRQGGPGKRGQKGPPGGPEDGGGPGGPPPGDADASGPPHP